MLKKLFIKDYKNVDNPQVRVLLPPPQFGLVVQLVRTLACHARGRRFDPDNGRHINKPEV